MYRLRPFEFKDWDAVHALHRAAGSAFEVPRRMEEAIVAVDEATGKVVAVQGTRATREGYVWVDHSWMTPQARWRVFEEMHEEIRSELERKNVGDWHIFVEPTSNGGHSGFAKRLMKRLGWIPAAWRCYSRKAKNG